MPSPETLPYNPEAARSAERLRSPLVEVIVEHSKGTVGLLLSAKFSPEQKQHMMSAMESRGAVAAGEGLMKTGNGIANYGERPIYSNGDNISYAYEESIGQFKDNSEELHFIDVGDGNVDVRYSFAAPGYTDEAGRPGNIFRSGFIVPEKEAKQLHEAVSRDPRVMDGLLEAQMDAIGIDSETWEKIKPRYRFDYLPGNLDDDNRRMVVFEHNLDGAVEDREEVVLGEAKERLKITSNIETDATAEQTLEAMKVYVMTARGQGIELDKIPNPYDYEDLKGVSQDVYDAAEAVLDSDVPYDELEKLLETARSEY